MRIALVTTFLAGLVVGQTHDGAFNQFLNRVFTRESIEKYDNIQIDFTGLGNPKATIRTIFQDKLKSGLTATLRHFPTPYPTSWPFYGQT